MNEEQANYYTAKLRFETDAWDLATALAAGEAITIVDARSPVAFAREHIPGAVNIPHRDMTPESTATIPVDHRVVAYCDGIGCNASTKGALNLCRLGFRVQELIGGLDWWKRDGYPTEGEVVAEPAAPGCGCS